MEDKDRPKIAASDEGVGDLIGRYRLIERIGQGAWGSVWLAEQTEDIQRRVALKILKLGLDTKDFLARFDSERQAMAMMDHTHVAKILDTGSTEYGRPYLVMEYIDGLPLLEYADEKKLSVRERVALYVEVCQALNHAHEKRIIHRDIKPSNILVAEQDGRPLPKIIDFGIAKTNEVRLSDKAAFTNIHTFIGTPMYSSPEQLEFMGVEVDARSDVYSLGAVLYQLLCGKTVFELDTLSRQGVEVVRKALKDDDPPLPSERFGCLAEKEQKEIASNRRAAPGKIEAALDGDLDGIVMKCLEKNPERRYETAGAMAEDLTAYLENRPVVASRPNLFTHARKFLQRHQIERNAVLVVIVIAVVASVFILSERRGGYDSEPAFEEAFGEPGSVAVMPFEALGEDEGGRPLADGFQSEVVSALSRHDRLRTLSRTATSRYREKEVASREIGRELGVANLLTGSIGEIEGTLRVSVQLVDTRTDAVVWSNSYRREAGEKDLFQVQSDLSRSISSDVEAVLAPESDGESEQLPTQNLEALKAYLAAKEIVDRDIDTRMGEALEFFQKAVDLDPNFALAYVGLAEVYRQRSISEFVELSREEIGEKMQEAIDRAMELDGRLPQVYALDGFSKMTGRDNAQARASFQRALELSPDFPYALYGLAALGIREASGREAFRAAAIGAVETMERVIKMKPKNPYFRYYMGSILGAVNRRSEILEHYRMAAFHNPDSVDANNRLALHWTREYSRYDEAIVYQRKAHYLKPDVVDFAANIREAYDTLGGYEEAAFWTEREMKLNREVAPMYRANLFRFQGKTSEAIKAYRENLALYEDGLSYEGGRLWTLYHDLREGDLETALDRYRKGASQLFEQDPQIRGGRMAQLALEVAALLQASGEEETSSRLIERVETVYDGAGPSSNRSFYLAVINTLKGDRQAALSQFRSAVDEGFRNGIMLADARLDPLRNDTRFVASMDIVETDMAEQLENIRRMEANGELAPLPPLPE